jgi:hypothetical protein
VPAVSFILRFLQGTGVRRIAALMPPVFACPGGQARAARLCLRYWRRQAYVKGTKKSNEDSIHPRFDAFGAIL